MATCVKAVNFPTLTMIYPPSVAYSGLNMLHGSTLDDVSKIVYGADGNVDILGFLGWVNGCILIFEVHNSTNDQTSCHHIEEYIEPILEQCYLTILTRND